MTVRCLIGFSREATLTPDVVGLVAAKNLLGEPADYLIIADQSFIPAPGDTTHPLARYVARQEDQNWTIKVVSIQDIQSHYGGGMALPEAATNYLKAADQALGFTHVLLVGDDSYDYLDKLGLGSMSFIPTAYRKTTYISHTQLVQIVITIVTYPQHMGKS